MTTQAAATPSSARKNEPGVFIILRPESDAYPIVRRVSRAAHGERTGKDFVDFFGNVSVLVHFGPLTRELIDSQDNWRELIPRCDQKMDAERELYIGGRSGQELMIVFLTDSSTRSELPRWKELLRWIVARFY